MIDQEVIQAMKYRNPEEWAVREANLEALYEMENVIPMLPPERKALRAWVSKGHDPENNPWGYLDQDDWPMNYVEAYRRRHGYFFNIYYHIIEE